MRPLRGIRYLVVFAKCKYRVPSASTGALQSLLTLASMLLSRESVYFLYLHPGEDGAFKKTLS
jgi:hypothetical protein